MHFGLCRRKYPSNNRYYIEGSDICNKVEAEENDKDDELLLFCDGDEAEKNKDRLLSFDGKKYELVTADEKFDDVDDFDYSNAVISESSPPNLNSPKGNSQSKISYSKIMLHHILSLWIIHSMHINYFI